jgi:hypothetical protein
MGKNMSNFDIIWQNLQIQMDQYESNFDEVTKQKYGIYWTNLDLAYEIVSNLVDTFDEDFLENITNKNFLSLVLEWGVLFSHF